MANQTLHFGAKGWNGNTPPAIKTTYRILLTALLVWQMIDMTFPEIPDGIASYVSRFLDISAPIMYIVGNAFGYTKE